MLSSWGWDDRWANESSQLPEGVALARVTSQERDRWTVQLEHAPAIARLAGSFSGSMPVTGDWVTTLAAPYPGDPLSIAAVLPRRTVMSRGRAGNGATEQVLAANIDVIWIVHGLDAPLNARRLERYLAMAWESGAVPEVVLTKADLADDAAFAPAVLEATLAGVSVHVVSVDDPDTVERLRASLVPGQTVALLGPSGAGKSTLINALANAALSATGDVREFDRKGRHTTTRRELFPLPGGSLLMDTPGLRELRVWSLDEGLGHAFPEIEQLAEQCRFRDCQHEREPGCAVNAAAATGSLDPGRLANYRKLRAETAYVERQSDHQARIAAVSKHKTALKTMKYHHKYQSGEG